MRRVREVLQVLHMDNEDMVWRCVHHFNRLYWHRRQRPGFRRSVHKENVALAAAVWKQMVLLRMPRPVAHVVKLCGLDGAGPLLRVGDVLNFSKAEAGELEGWYEYEEAPPQDYLWTLCAYMSLPFWLPACASRLVETSRVSRILLGVNPVHIAAGCLVSVAGKFPRYSETVNASSVCHTLGCGVNAVKRVVARIPEYELDHGDLEELGQTWLASRVQLRMTTSATTVGGSLTVEFKKDKRRLLAAEKRRVQLERAEERKHASQKRWEHLKGLTTWLQSELAQSANGGATEAPAAVWGTPGGPGSADEGTAHVDESTGR